MMQNFYVRDDISRMLPGKKDYVFDSNKLMVKESTGKRGCFC